MCICKHIGMFIFMCACIYICMCVCMLVCRYVCMFMHVCLGMYVCMFMHVCIVYVCVFVFFHVPMCTHMREYVQHVWHIKSLA